MHFFLSLLLLAAAPAASAPPTGDSPATAVVDPATSESNGVDWEYAYLRGHPCDGTTPWKLRRQALVQANNRVYDVLDVVCPATNVERRFFFDITSYFGKP